LGVAVPSHRQLRGQISEAQVEALERNTAASHTVANALDALAANFEQYSHEVLDRLSVLDSRVNRLEAHTGLQANKDIEPA
jgi:hypothetical protein